MNRVIGMAVAAALGAVAIQGCQSKPGTGLPEPVAEQSGASAPGGQPSGALPSNHPPMSATGPIPQSPPAVDRPLPAGTRNPMEDIMAFKARLDKNPNDYEALVSLGNANMMISRLEAAQELYVRALAINPKDVDARTNLAIAYKYGGKPEQAFAELNKNLAIDPDNDSTLYNLGFLYLYDKHDRKEALAIWKKWLALYPNAPAAADVSKQIAQIETEMGKGAVSSK
ncbi:MAG TPA: tetratricopeptide repeat protein [Nitrospiria bacterium]|nr:tetratricopeptide repeat protein [Nitrospiria bacterium]